MDRCLRGFSSQPAAGIRGAQITDVFAEELSGSLPAGPQQPHVGGTPAADERSETHWHLRCNMCCCVQRADVARAACRRSAEACAGARALPLGVRCDHLVPQVRGIWRGSASRAAEALPRPCAGPWWSLHHASAPSRRAAPVDPGAAAQGQAAEVAMADSFDGSKLVLRCINIQCFIYECPRDPIEDCCWLLWLTLCYIPRCSL